MSFEPRDYLRHILDEADFLIREASGVTAEQFKANDTLQRAFVRSLEVIGEAARNMSEDIRDGHPEIAWKQITGTRDRLIHGYFDVDLDIIWAILTRDLPPLISSLEELLSQEER